MAYDIYGNSLRRGHCEVHPHVHEEYPCSVCFDENRQREHESRQQRDYYSQMEREHNEQLEEMWKQELISNEIAIVSEHAKTFGRFLKVN